jgi:competence protein ComEC
MINWQKYPFVRILLPFALGIWISIFFGLKPDMFSLTLLSFFLVFLIFLVSRWLKSYRFRWIFGTTISIFFVIQGALFVQIHDASQKENHLCNVSETPLLYVARVSEQPVERAVTTKTVLELQYALFANKQTCPIKGNVLAYFKKSDSIDAAVAYGDVVAFSEHPQLVEAPTNPGQFDYRKYLSNKNIFHQIFIKEKDWIKIDSNQVNPIFELSYAIRTHLLNVLQKNGVLGDEFAVASAILLGYDDSLPSYLRKGYVAAGAMHVLCVSGLHVGIIFMVAGFLLSFLGKRVWQRILKILLLLFLIWFYALLTGLSPSIQRAAFMISFFLIGQLINRKGFAINSVAASAFLILCINPYNLFMVGFQLSYTAVLGIVIFQNWINGWIYFKTVIFRKIWEMTSVTLAAQLGTTPLVLLYFNQFPTYFWLSNLLLVPLSFLIIALGVALLTLSFVPYLSAWLGKLVSMLIYVMNLSILKIESFPLSILKGLFVSPIEFILLTIIVLCLTFYVRHKHQNMLIISLMILLFLGISVNYRNFERQKEYSFVVYDVKKHTAIDFIYGKEHVLYADTILAKDISALNFYVESYWIKKGLSPHPSIISSEQELFESNFLRRKSNLISFGGKLIALFDPNEYVGDSLDYKTFVDYLIVSKGHYPNLDKALNCYDVGTLVIDGTVSEHNAQKWAEKAEEQGLMSYNVHKEGAFIVQID